MRRSLAVLLLLLWPVATLADDLRQWVPTRELPGILERLRRDHHRHFAVVDYSQRSSEPRFLLFERRSHTLLGRFRVAHGRGSDADHDGYAERFSDRPGSLASSLGVFRTAEVFQSEAPGHGLSMRLEGTSKNYLRCHRGVKNRLVRESDQNAHLPRVNCAFSPVFALR